MRARWLSAIVAVLGIAGTVGVFCAMLALARGFHATLVNSGSPQNALIRRAGSSAELDGSVALDQVKVIEDAPGIMRENGQPLGQPRSGGHRRLQSQSHAAPTPTCKSAAYRKKLLKFAPT